MHFKNRLRQTLVLAALLQSGAYETYGLEERAAVQSFNRDTPAMLLARMVWGEARSCTKEEQIAVGYTAMNRQKKTKRPLSEILLEGYTCFKGKSLNQIMQPHIYDDPKVFDHCIDLAKNILRGAYTDPTNGATHYYNPKHASPFWASTLKNKIRLQTSKGLSKHLFGRIN